jgi:lysophospholipase L1-like esterase
MRSPSSLADASPRDLPCRRPLLRASVLKGSLAAACLCALAAGPLPSQAAGWVGTWGAAPLPPTPAMGPFPGTPTFSNVTIRQIVRVSSGGQRLRVRLTNEYGTKPLRIGKATIALADASGAVLPGTQHPLTFDGQPGVTIPPAAPFVSDAVDLRVPPLSNVSISLYLPDDTGPCTCHQTGVQTGYVSKSGDFTADPSFAPAQKIQIRAFISGVEVETPGKAIVVLGDSISDGVGSTLDANHRWPDLLANRLRARGGDWGVVNMGISGNRVLADGAGQSALARLDRDVLSVPGGAYVIVFEGVNDLGIAFGHPTGPMAKVFSQMAPPHKVTAEEMIAGYRQIITRAHEKGLKVVGATITPYGGAAYYSTEGEAVRERINDWIRTGHAFDGVIDFDAAIRDPEKPTEIRNGYHAGDHLHGSDAGYEAMARTIDLSIFK